VIKRRRILLGSALLLILGLGAVPVHRWPRAGGSSAPQRARHIARCRGRRVQSGVRTGSNRPSAVPYVNHLPAGGLRRRTDPGTASASGCSRARHLATDACHRLGFADGVGAWPAAGRPSPAILGQGPHDGEATRAGCTRAATHTRLLRAIRDSVGSCGGLSTGCAVGPNPAAGSGLRWPRGRHHVENRIGLDSAEQYFESRSGRSPRTSFAERNSFSPSYLQYCHRSFSQLQSPSLFAAVRSGPVEEVA
jgi:hypothetical protein